MWVLVFKISVYVFSRQGWTRQGVNSSKGRQSSRTTMIDFLFLCRMYRINEEINKTEKTAYMCTVFTF